MATEYPRTRYSVLLALAAIRRVVGNPHLQRLNDPGDLRGAADLGWSECVQRWQSDRASLSTYAWPRMGGRVRDLQRNQRRHLQLTALYADELRTVATSTAPSWTEPLSLRQAIAHCREQMTPAERSILQRVYHQDGTLVEAAADCGESNDAIHRAHRRLLSRLRAAAGVPEPKPRRTEAATDPWATEADPPSPTTADADSCASRAFHAIRSCQRDTESSAHLGSLAHLGSSAHAAAAAWGS